MGLNGEPAWICLMCCNCDILFSAIVLHWVTLPDRDSTTDSANSCAYHNGEELGEIGRKRRLTGERQNGIRHPTLERCGSDASVESSRFASSTKAIVEDDAEMPHDRPVSIYRANKPPNSSGKDFYEEPAHRQHRTSTIVQEVADESENVAASGVVTRTTALVPPAVHVHIDYGSEVSSKPANTEHGALGNTVTIETGDESTKRPRANHRNLLHPGEAI